MTASAAPAQVSAQAAAPAPVRDAPVPAQNQWSKGRPRTEDPPKPVEKPQLSSWEDTSRQTDISPQVQAATTASIDSLIGPGTPTASSASVPASPPAANGGNTATSAPTRADPMGQYLSDNSGLSTAFAQMGVDSSYGSSSAKSAHKTAEAAPQQAQAAAAFNNAYMPNPSTAGSMPAQQYQQPAQQAQRAAPPPPQVPEQQA